MQDALHRLDLDGIEIAYWTVGDEHAPAVVLLHGWASSSRMWQSARGFLADGFHLVAVDLPGHGESGKPPWTWYTIPRFADAVEGLIRRLRLERTSVIGHSMGGTIALELAGRTEALVRTLIVVNPVVTGRVYSRSVAFRDRWVEPAVRISRRVWPTASRLLTRPPHAIRQRAPASVLRNSEDFGRTTADSVFGSMQAILTWDVRPRLSSIRARSLVIVGDADRVVSPAEGEVAAAEIPNARLIRLPAAHHPNDEMPRTLYPEIRRFLSGGGLS
jgi:pimeloyl-ACP methyl ester carboxylesterase